MYEKHRQGQWAEELALTFFEKQDFRLLARNFTSYWGEIDLILEIKQEIVFVEVRLRRDVGFGGGLESVTQKKQKRILKTALFFLQKFSQYQQRPCRFDVLSIKPTSAATCSDDAEIHWIPSAFDASCL